MFDKEKISSLMATETTIYKFAVEKIEKGDETFSTIAKQIVQANQNKKLAKKLTKDLHHILVMVDMSEINTPPQPRHSTDVSDGEYTRVLNSGIFPLTGKTTNVRKEQLRIVTDNIPSTMSESNAVKTLQVIDGIAERSHS